MTHLIDVAADRATLGWGLALPESVFEATKVIDPVLMRAQLRVGTVVRDKWHVDVLLGVGGMAAVYAATHRNGTRAALKVLHPELCTHADVRSRFLREGYLANRIGHAGAVRVADDDVAEDGALFLVMELLDGESLEDRRVRLGGKLDVDEVLAAADQLLDVLAAAHEKGVVHRDIKPENVFLTRTGQVKVLDFGIARLRELSSVSMATITGITLGTPCYMSPEQARGLWDEVDAQSDLWAVGATMFALITGRVVHDGRTPNEALVSAMTTAAPAIRSVDSAVPGPAAAVVDKALAFAKPERWPSAVAMQQAIREGYQELHNAPISSCPPLSVPPSVSDKTLPADGMDLPPGLFSPTTGQAAATGWTVVSRSLASMPKGMIAAAAVVTTGIIVVLFALAVRLIASRHVGERASASGEKAPPVATTPAPSMPAPSVAVIVGGDPNLAPAPSSGVPAAAISAPPTKRPVYWKDRRK